MVFKLNLCLYKQTWKCYWIIGLLVCINFWLISKLNLSQSKNEKTNRVQSQFTSTSSSVNQTNQRVYSPIQVSTEVQTNIEVLEKPTFHIEDIFKSELIDVNLGRFDFSRKYKMFDNVIIGTKYVNLSIEYDVTLATQSSLDKLHWISHIAR
jgi:hypothetical protein